MTGNSSSLAKRYTTILSVVALYWFVSITLVFLNKSLLSGGTSVDAPLFITCFQCTVTAAACYAIVSLPPNVWEAKNLACGQITISIQTLKKVLPLSVVCIGYLSYIVLGFLLKQESCHLSICTGFFQFSCLKYQI